MDIPKKARRAPGRIRQAALLILVLVACVYAWDFLRNDTTVIDLNHLVTGSVSTDSLSKEVRATGTLVPNDLRWIAAIVDGRIEEIAVEAGEEVSASSVLMKLSNPTLTRDLDTALLELEVLEARALALEKRLVRDQLSQEAVVVELEAQYENARFRKEANEELNEELEGVVSAIDTRESVLLEQQLKARLETERQRLGHLRELQDAEILANKAEIKRARRQVRLQRELLDGLTIVAGIDGVVQEVPFEVGERIATGALLARVAREDNLKAELRVQESRASSVGLGQPVTIAAGGQRVGARISRIDPAVQNGVVLVDATFTGAMLPGARPDLRVEGVIETDFIDSTLVMPRPVFSRENSTLDLFVVRGRGSLLEKTAVSVGIGSVDRIQVLDGLQPGDAVVLSDMSRFDEQTKIRIAD